MEIDNLKIYKYDEIIVRPVWWKYTGIKYHTIDSRLNANEEVAWRGSHMVNTSTRKTVNRPLVMARCLF